MEKKNYNATIKACYMGYITQAIIVNFMPILFVIFQDEFNISIVKLGNLVLLNFVTQIFADIFGEKYIDKIGFRRAVIPALTFAAAGLILLGWLPGLLPDPYIGIAISVVLFAFGGGLIEVVVSPVVDALPNEDGSAAMSLLHSFYCWGQLAVVLITTLVLKVFGNVAWRYISIVWAIVPVADIICFSKVKLPETCVGERRPMKELLKSKIFVIALVLMLCSGAAEQTIAQWASLFAQKGLGVSKVVGDLLGPCLFALFMALGRTFYGIKGDKIDLKNALLFSGVLCVVCYILTVFSGWAIMSLAACAVTGLSVSLMWPGVLADTSESIPRGGAAMFAMMAIFGDIGCSFGPWLAGMVSDIMQNNKMFLDLGLKFGMESEQFALKAGIFTGIMFPIVMIICILMLKKERKKNGYDKNNF